MKIELFTEEEEHLRKLQRSLKDSPGYAKVTCILMVVKGSEPQFVAECLGMDTATVYRWIGAYRRGGIDGVMESRCKGWWRMLDSFRMAALSNELRERVYTTAKSVRAWISEEFGVEYTREGVAGLLNRMGFTYNKTSEVSCKADAAQQEAPLLSVENAAERAAATTTKAGLTVYVDINTKTYEIQRPIDDSYERERRRRIIPMDVLPKWNYLVKRP